MEWATETKTNLRTIRYGDGRQFIEGDSRFGTLISASKIFDGEFLNGKL